MLIKRDIAKRLEADQGVYAHILIGPRQCGKSTLFAVLSAGQCSEVTFDDFQISQMCVGGFGVYFSHVGDDDVSVAGLWKF